MIKYLAALLMFAVSFFVISSIAVSGPDFLRLANALSALCEEKRLLDAMLLAVPR